MTNLTMGSVAAGTPTKEQPPIKVRYVLYARKSTEQDELQALSIDSQIKEMMQIAVRDNLEIAEIKRESHSAKSSGQRPVFNEIVADIRSGKYNAILTWNPDRLSRNGGDLGSLVDLLDQKLLVEIRTYNQKFTNSPNEKFLLMILCSTAKLENDNKTENVKRGLRARVSAGLWPTSVPTGYLPSKDTDHSCEVVYDARRAPILRQMFEKIANEKWSGRQLHRWLKNDLDFKTRNGKHLSVANIYTILHNPFYYGEFEYPRGSGQWYQGKHKPVVAKELFDKVREQLRRDFTAKSGLKEFAFTRLMTCALCGSGITAMEKFRELKGGGANRHVYYGCSRSKDTECKNRYTTEENLVSEFIKLIPKLRVKEDAIRAKFEEEYRRVTKFQKSFLGAIDANEAAQEFNIAKYATYVLREGSVSEKREFLGMVEGKFILKKDELGIAAADKNQ